MKLSKYELRKGNLYMFVTFDEYEECCAISANRCENSSFGGEIRDDDIAELIILFKKVLVILKEFDFFEYFDDKLLFNSILKFLFDDAQNHLEKIAHQCIYIYMKCINNLHFDLPRL